MESLMTSFRDLRRLGACLLAPAVVSAVLLTACGGGTSQVTSFVPDRLIALGDENSVIVNDGSNDGFKYTVNDRRSTAAGKCEASPIIVQTVAAHYGYVFAECNPNNVTPKAFIHAVAGALIEDPLTGLAAQRAAVANLGSTDLVSVMIGGNDLIALYEQVRAGTLTDSAAVDEAKRRGRSAATIISGILATGARALVMTVPDLSLSPYSINAGKTDSNANALLHTLSHEFNGSLRTNILPDDGRNFGLVLADDIVAVMHDKPTGYLDSPYNVTDAACTSADVKDCVLTADTATTTLVSGATLSTHLWANDRLVGPAAHSRIGQQALARAVNNPF
jgi:outer membrane lipase/esterase